MLHDRLTIQFHGFHPSPETEEMVHEKLGLLSDKAAYEATVSAKFFRHDGHLKGTIAINSHGGRYFAVATGEHLREVLHAAVEQVHKQMDRSRSLRSRRPGLRSMAGRRFSRPIRAREDEVAS